MDHDMMRDRLLRADGIDARGVSGVELVRFRLLLSRGKATRISARRRLGRPLARLAVAAAVVLAAARSKTYLWSGASAVVWAAVLRKINGFETCIYRARQIRTTGPRPDGFEFAAEEESKNHRSEKYGTFTETYENGKLTGRSYLLLREKQHLFFSEGRTPRVCCRSPVRDESLREFDNKDPREIVATILVGEYMEIGTDVIEGKAVRGVEMRDPSFLMGEEDKTRHVEKLLDDFAARFWIDVRTQLPVWMEISFLFKGAPTRMMTIWDRFEWGVPLDESLFTPEIPTDCEIFDHEVSPKAPEPGPKSAAEEAFVQQTLAEPYLGDFDRLPLPDVSSLSLLGVDPNAPRPQVRLLGDTKIQTVHDETVAKWPRYEQVKDQLQQEFQAKLGIDALDVNGLVTTGIALRNRFWELGGCLSDVAYPYIYAARLLDEIAHQREPENEAIIDQLIESIVAYEVLAYHDDPAPERPRRNPLYTGLLADLRREQYQHLKAEVNHRYVPTWKDFVRCCDLIDVSRWRKDDALVVEVARLLVEQAPQAGWTYYLDRLERCVRELRPAPRTFVDGPFDIDISRAPYARRLRSFQGPEEYRRNLAPAHLVYLRGW
jgi:hypothetical protein